MRAGPAAAPPLFTFWRRLPPMLHDRGIRPTFTCLLPRRGKKLSESALSCLLPDGASALMVHHRKSLRQQVRFSFANRLCITRCPIRDTVSHASAMGLKSATDTNPTPRRRGPGFMIRRLRTRVLAAGQVAEFLPFPAVTLNQWQARRVDARSPLQGGQPTTPRDPRRVEVDHLGHRVCRACWWITLFTLKGLPET